MIVLRPFLRVVSAGDLVLMVGLVVTIIAGMRGTAPRRGLGRAEASAGTALQTV
jgi:hypothetical protein